ncbi:MAG: hypothetical protein NW226_13725 [Microscillaceae bacterium]|nr:hypothetical protein [Microscillaceae bacterium]
MVLNNKEIQQSIKSNDLISDAIEGNIKNCSYSMRIGEICEPETGDILTIEQDHPKTKNYFRFLTKSSSKNRYEGQRKKIIYCIRPSEVLIIKTKEQVKIPLDICASYTSLQSLASKGLLLINSSIVEPGYEGYLSCFIVNFSKQDICFEKDQEIVKLVFYKLTKEAQPLTKQTQLKESIASDDYSAKLALHATKFNRTFLDIESIEDRATKKAQTSIRKNITLGGVFIAVLLLFATLEPLLSKWIYKLSYKEDIVNRHELLEKITSLRKENSLLENQVQILKDSNSSIQRELKNLDQKLDKILNGK